MRAIVIGAGIIGLSIAWDLRRRGVDVTVIDPSPAQGASYAAAGMLAPAAEVVWGQSELYPLMRASADLYPDFAAELASASGCDLGYSRTGTLVCAGDRADLVSLRELVEAQRGAGFEVSLISGSDAREAEPALAPAVCGAVSIPLDHSIDPRRVTAALSTVLADDLMCAQVSDLLFSGGRTVGVELADGTHVEADQVIVAAGSECSSIAGVPVLPLREVWGEVIRLRAPTHLGRLLDRTIRGVVNGRSVYLVPRPDGEIVLGASSREDGQSGTNAGSIHRLLEDGQRLVPGILDCEVTEITTRARPGSPDDVPIIGRTDDGCVVSTGFFRHGVLLAPLGARLSADIVCGDDSPWAPPETLRAVAPDRFSSPTARPEPTQLTGSHR